MKDLGILKVTDSKALCRCFESDQQTLWKHPANVHKLFDMESKWRGFEDGYDLTLKTLSNF